MTDWYVSSAAYATYPPFLSSHAYHVGDIVVPSGGFHWYQAAGSRYVFRCIQAGISASQPAWGTTTGNNSTITSGTVTFANVTGQSAYFWGAAAGDILTLTGQVVGAGVENRRFFAGDRIFVSSDHNESFDAQAFVPNIAYHGSGNPTTTFGVNLFNSSLNGQILCVNRAGSTPPVAADLTTGAVVTSNLVGGDGPFFQFESQFPMYYYGISYVYGANTAGRTGFLFNVASNYSHYFDNCLLQLQVNNETWVGAGGGPCVLILNNTPINFGGADNSGASNAFNNQPYGYPLFIQWQNTTSALSGAPPAYLFRCDSRQSPIQATLRGVDLSALTGTLVDNSEAGCKILLDSCQINSALTRYAGVRDPGLNQADEVELVNCYDGTNILSERYTAGGKLVTERTITLNGGAQDDVGGFSHKIDTSVPDGNIDKFVYPFCSFWLDVENTAVGVSQTATVEIVSSNTLNNDEIALYLQYEGTAGSSFASFANSFIATPLTVPAAVTASTATWNSYPATPVTQKCQVTFTARHAGRLRGQIRVGIRTEFSYAPIYIDPQITLT